MTEAEWLACTNPMPMLDYLRGKASDRKLRLFACACCRAVSGQLAVADKRAVDVAERHADGSVDETTFALAVQQLQRASRRELRHLTNPHWITRKAMQSSPLDAALNTARKCRDSRLVSLSEMTSLLRCLFNNPFCPAAIAPSCMTAAVLALAQTIYDDQDFARLAVLADALEESGCTNTDILQHCRQQVEHVRGCWVIDLLLGKK